MAKKRDYIPGPIIAFFSFQNNLVTKAVAGAAGWNIAPAKITALQAQQTIYNPLFNAIDNPATKTKGAVKAHDDGRKVYEKYIRVFVKENLISNSAVTAQDKVDMALNPGDSTHHRRPKITTAPGILLTSLGGLEIRVECRVVGDETRPSIHPDADGLEFRVLVGNIPPPNYDQAPKTFFSTKARITQVIGDPGAAGQTIYLFARWKNNSDEGKSGPWSSMVQVVIR